MIYNLKTGGSFRALNIGDRLLDLRLTLDLRLLDRRDLRLLDLRLLDRRDLRLLDLRLLDRRDLRLLDRRDLRLDRRRRLKLRPLHLVDLFPPGAYGLAILSQFLE